MAPFQNVLGIFMGSEGFLESLVAQNDRLLYPKVAQNQEKVAPNDGQLVFPQISRKSTASSPQLQATGFPGKRSFCSRV